MTERWLEIGDKAWREIKERCLERWRIFYEEYENMKKKQAKKYGDWYGKKERGEDVRNEELRRGEEKRGVKKRESERRDEERKRNTKQRRMENIDMERKIIGKIKGMENREEERRGEERSEEKWKEEERRSEEKRIGEERRRKNTESAAHHSVATQIGHYTPHTACEVQSAWVISLPFTPYSVHVAFLNEHTSSLDVNPNRF